MVELIMLYKIYNRKLEVYIECLGNLSLWEILGNCFVRCLIRSTLYYLCALKLSMSHIPYILPIGLSKATVFMNFG